MTYPPSRAIACRAHLAGAASAGVTPARLAAESAVEVVLDRSTSGRATNARENRLTWGSSKATPNASSNRVFSSVASSPQRKARRERDSRSRMLGPTSPHQACTCPGLDVTGMQLVAGAL